MSTVSIVHCIDTEGPLNEPTEATFERIKFILNIKSLDINPTRFNLEKILNGEIELKNDKGVSALDIISPHLLKLNNSWDKIYEMFETIEDSKIRFKILDNNNSPWKFTFHILDHVEYQNNPRRRTIGYNAIFEEYLKIHNKNLGDELEFHFHPMNYTKDAHRCATAYDYGGTFNEVLSRRLINHSFFPSSFRAGFQTIRNDSNLLLEQWIPFDISNMAEDDYAYLDNQNDFANGRSGDWRNAPSDWSVYSPSLKDWRKKGNLNRNIARALNPLNRIGRLTYKEIEKAFITAQKGVPVILGIASHDFRDLNYEINFCQKNINIASRKYPEVPFYFESTRDAFRRALKLNPTFEKPILTLRWKVNDVPELKINAENIDLFMMQPYIAIQTKANNYFRDNANLGINNTFYYAFNFDTIDIENVEKIGIALTTKSGIVWTKVIDRKTLNEIKLGASIDIDMNFR